MPSLAGVTQFRKPVQAAEPGVGVQAPENTAQFQAPDVMKARVATDASSAGNVGRGQRLAKATQYELSPLTLRQPIPRLGEFHSADVALDLLIVFTDSQGEGSTDSPERGPYVAGPFSAHPGRGSVEELKETDAFLDDGYQSGANRQP